MDPKTQADLNLVHFRQGYRHMAELFAKIAYTVFWLKVVFNCSAVKSFHIYDTSLISVSFKLYWQYMQILVV